MNPASLAQALLAEIGKAARGGGRAGDGQGYIEVGKQGWQGFANLVTGQALPVTILNPKFSKAGVYTVQFHVTPPPNVTGSQGVFATVATIVWNTEGQQVSRQCSVANGTSISAPAEGVKVMLVDDTFAIDDLDLGQPYQVRVTITPGVRPNTQQPVTLEGKGVDLEGPERGAVTILPAGSIAYTIPPLAGVISAEVVGIDEVTNEMPLQVTVTQSAFLFTSKVYNANPARFEPISQLAQVLTVKNNGPNNVIMTLTWGIDG
jgi:hypothetical protein